MSAAAGWNPRGFADYRQFYPQTPDVARRIGVDATAQFVAAWDATAAQPLPRPRTHASLVIVFVRGLFGNWIPVHLAKPLAVLRALGCIALVARSRAAGSIAVNARMLAADIERRIPARCRLVFLCHSKGGLDLLEALRQVPGLRGRAAALVLCQTPRAGCAVLDSVLLRAHDESLRSRWQRTSESLAKAAIVATGSAPGCLELTGGTIAARIGAFDDVVAAIPTVAIASWSAAPTAWLDSQHARLREIRPGCAHDGLFFLEDLVWPNARQVLLPRIDHSQPCVGGHGFAHDRFWLAVTTLAIAEAEAAQ